MALGKTPFAKYVEAIRAAPPETYNWRLFLTVACFALSGQAKGWDEGSMASITNLSSFKTSFHLTPTKNPDTVSNLISFVNLTAGIGAFLSYLINDRVGRIWSLRIYEVLYIAGSLISTLSYGNIGALYAGRLIAGLGIGALTVIGPMTIVEIAPRASRGLMTLWFNVAMLGGQMLGIFVCYGCSLHVNPKLNLQWQIPFFVQTFIPAIAIILSFYVYESPRWLCMTSQNEKALASLSKIRGLPASSPFINAEFMDMSSQSAQELAEYGSPTLISTVRETFLVRSNLRRVQLTCMAYILAQMSGANAVTNYLPTIFGLIGVSNSNTQIFSTGFYAISKLIFCIIASLFFVDAIGRRKSLLIGITTQMLCHTYLGAYLKIYLSRKTVSSGASDTAIAAIYIHSFGWAIGLYSLPYLFGAELWPNRIRSFGSSLSQGFHWFFYFALTKATPSILQSMGTYGAFFFFAAWCLVAWIYTFIMIPETSGRTLESMDKLFEFKWYEMRRNAYIDQDSAVAKVLEEDPEKNLDENIEFAGQPK